MTTADSAEISRGLLSRATWSNSRLPLLVGIGLIAFLVRLMPLLIGGGLGSYGRYDDGVYYTASDALTFGRVPYRDFVLLHPPGILIVLAPFALLGRVTSDPVGMAAARVAFMLIGALNAVLVTVLADRWGRKAAIASGVIYACWLPAVYAEQSTLLEPLGGTALLVALLLLLKTAKPPTVRAELLAGVALGLGCSLKIWYVASWAAVLGWQLVARKPLAAARVLVGGAVALGVVLLPFFVMAPTRMFDLVVRDQLLRSQNPTSRRGRLSSILGVKPLFAGHPAAVHFVTALAVVALVAAMAFCSTEPAARVLVAVLGVNLLVLLASPSYFPHYASLIAAPAALVLGVAIGKLCALQRPNLSLRRAVLVVAILAFLAAGLQTATTRQGKVFPGRKFDRAAGPGCVAADDPQALIQMNRLSRDLGSGCEVPVDVTGITYDSLHRVNRHGKEIGRGRNTAFQKYLYNYLTSAHSFVVIRKHSDGTPPSIQQMISVHPALATSHSLVLRAGNGSG
jgi:alpha-1,2-mannosyltransferase